MKAAAVATTTDSVVQFSVKFDRIFHARVKALATVQQTTTHSLIERAVSDYLDQHWDNRIGVAEQVISDQG